MPLPPKKPLPFERARLLVAHSLGVGAQKGYWDLKSENLHSLIRFLEKQTDQRFGDELSRWRKWIWNQPLELHPDYPLFKASLYGQIDRRMAEFFPPDG